VPWKQKSKEIKDLVKAEEVLNEDHFGLEKIKERHPRVSRRAQLVKNPKGSILCFVGPPGVGKTSLGKSIARATGPQVSCACHWAACVTKLRFAAIAARTSAPFRADHSDDEEGRRRQSGVAARRSR
jgi:replication-associated recombination protein RarA